MRTLRRKTVESKPNFQLLLSMATTAERVPDEEFDIGTIMVFHSHEDGSLVYDEFEDDDGMPSEFLLKHCSTIGCVVGHYYVEREGMTSADGIWDRAKDETQMSKPEFDFLFSANEEARIVSDKARGAYRPRTGDYDRGCNGPEAAARIRKYVYYKLRKAEMFEMYYAQTGKRENIEGDQGFACEAAEHYDLAEEVEALA